MARGEGRAKPWSGDDDGFEGGEGGEGGEGEGGEEVEKKTDGFREKNEE